MTCVFVGVESEVVLLEDVVRISFDLLVKVV